MDMMHPCSLHLHLLLVLLLLSLLFAVSSAAVRANEFIYNGFSGADLTMDGEASVTDGLLRLTNGQQQSEGHAFYTYPLNFTDVSNGGYIPSFSTTFVFSIIGPYDDLSSHGFAFVLSSTKELFSALPGQFLGLLNSFNNGNASNHLLAIEFDTILNSEFRDIDGNHVGIDVNGLISVASHTAGYYTSDVIYAGFSSANGMLDSKHYILGWSFKLNGEAAALNYSALSLTTIQGLAQQIHPRQHNYKTIICAVLLPGVTISTVVFGILVIVHMKRRSKARKNELEWEMEYGPPSFTYKDLLAATNGFSDKVLLGRGGFGSVYKGVMPLSKQTVAIKRVSPESKQGMKEFMAEIVILGHLRHRNLVQLLGYCRHKQQLLLVYDYMPNRSLDCYLYSQENIQLCWPLRFHIIKGVASGLFYLHEDWEQVVIHRDIKTSNVLLDSEMNARLGDFGLARSHDHGADAHTTHMAGTWGYIAPELARLGKATKATDVFAFGVFMMEVVCARRPILMNALGEPLALADWVLSAWQRGSIIEAVDPRLHDSVEEEIELVLKLGLLCSHSSPSTRPSMRLVMLYLERDAPLPADLQTSLLSTDVSQDEMPHQHTMSCPATTITDLSNGR